MAAQPPASPAPVPPLSASPFGNLRFDAIAGFLVFLIAVPLCLAIAQASGFPPVAGIWTAVIGGVLTSGLSNSQLTVKGPAAGLIVIVAGAVSELGQEFGAHLPEDQRARLGYELALGVGLTAGVVQVLFGQIRAGRLVEFFPLTPVHGMLASIGIIITARQAYEVVGAAPTKGAGPLLLLAEFPGKLLQMNPEIAGIGLVGLAVLFGLPQAAKRVPHLKRVPAQLVVLILAVGLGAAFDLEHEHTYLFPARLGDGRLENGGYAVGPKFLVTMPEQLTDPASAFAVPDFRGLATGTGLKFLLLFSLIGSLESLLSAKAIELIDPWRRKTDFDRELLAVGAANTLAAALGGLPMISEIVRSKANVDSGARTRWANACHGLFLLAFVLLFPNLIHRIPLAALGAMLVYTGFRLADPTEFVKTFRIGTEQFVVFVGTIAAALATDLLVGIGVGIALEAGFHLWHGATVRCFMTPDVSTVTAGGRVRLTVRRSVVFTNWLGLRGAILAHAAGRDEVIVDLHRTRLVDHSVMEKLCELEREFAAAGRSLRVVGLHEHRPLSGHPLAARKRPAAV